MMKKFKSKKKIEPQRLVKFDKETSKALFKQTFKNVFLNYNFILFHFVVFFIPFFSTMMAGIKGPNGALYVISVGLATSFITIFNQFLFLLAAALIFVCKNHKQFYNDSCPLDGIDRNSVNSIMLLFSLISIGLFILTSYFYITYSSYYQNIMEASNYGLYYILMLTPSILFNSYIYLDLIYINEKKRWLATLFIVLLLALNMILIPVFHIYIPFSESFATFGIGLAVSVSSFVILLLIHFICNNKYHFHFNPKQTWILFKKTSTFILNFLLATFMKTVLIVVIAISLALSTKSAPINLMLSKIIWYNSLYFCEFFADGLLYAIEFANMRSFANKREGEFSGKAWLALSGISALVVLVTCVIFNCSIPSLAQLYTSHQLNPIASPLPPQIQSAWPYGSGVSAVETAAYLWAPQGVANFKLFNPSTFSFKVVPAYSIMYTTIYHVFISATKIMGISEIDINQKFNLKAVISKFIIIAIVMVFISVFSIVPSDSEWFNNLFPGIDGFSFALMLIGILLFILTILGIKKALIAKQKESIEYLNTVEELNANINSNPSAFNGGFDPMLVTKYTNDVNHSKKATTKINVATTKNAKGVSKSKVKTIPSKKKAKA